MKENYDDIINLPNHRSKTRPHMSLHDRAAQFSPFAALSGHEAAIEETGRLTNKRIVLTEEVKVQLNAKLALIANQLEKEPRVSITFFLPDERKSGGAYITETGTVKKIDQYEGLVVMQNDVVIPMHDIISIEGEIFSDSEMLM